MARRYSLLVLAIVNGALTFTQQTATDLSVATLDGDAPIIGGLPSAEPSSPVKFLIRHTYYNRYLGPHIKPWFNYLYNISSENAVADNLYWTIEPQDGLWGFIRNVRSNKILHPAVIPPYHGTLIIEKDSGDHEDYFLLDQINNNIVNRNGKRVQPYFYAANKDKDTFYICLEPEHYSPKYLEFVFVDPNNRTQEVLPYGMPVVAAEWVLLVNYMNPVADGTWKKEVKVGKLKTESTTNTHEFAWEATISAKAWFVEASASISGKKEMQHSSAQTWSEEHTITQTINVKKGQPFARWQRVYVGSQLGHKATFDSPSYADTKSDQIKPDETTPTYVMT